MVRQFVAVAAVVTVGWVGAAMLFSSCIQSSTPAQSGFPSVGEQGTITMGKPGLSIPVAVDENALHDMVAAYAAKDQYGVQELMQAGKVFDVEPATQAKYLDSNWTGGFRLRILSGVHTGDAVWLPHEFFKRQ